MDIMVRQRLLTLRPRLFIGAPVLIMVLAGLGRVTTDHATTDVVITDAAGDGSYFAEGLRSATGIYWDGLRPSKAS
jgi:hypothetical protein